MAPFVVVYDASVLYPIRIAGLLVRLAQKGFVQAKWTADIHEEWIRNLLENNPNNPRITRDRLERRREAMDRAVRDCLVEGYERLIEAIEIRDPDDRHVVAAAIRAKAQSIVANDKDFGDGALDAWDLDHQTADEFIQGLIEINRELVVDALGEEWRGLKNPPYAPEEFLANLETVALNGTVAELRDDFMKAV
jgi:predicted nucleic acid-binding protein